MGTLTKFASKKALSFTESVIREMTREANKYGAINLAQGFPDFPAPDDIKAAAKKAIDLDMNQYSITWGNKNLREAIAKKVKWYLNLEIDPEREITVCCGSTEAMVSSVLATVDQGDEVIVFEPFYENYWPDTILAGAIPKYVKLHPPHFRFDEQELKNAFTNKTKAIILCTPNNPTGRVFDKSELRCIADLCVKWNALAITDEIYEHILFDNLKHHAIATLEGMRERTITINSFSKTYALTGWRVGYAIAQPNITDSIRKVHDFLTVGAPTPFQEAGVCALSKPESYYTDMATFYQQKRDKIVTALSQAGFKCFPVEGAYYVFTDISNFGFENDITFVKHLIQNIGLAGVPGSSFFNNPADGKNFLRFCFCKKDETLEAAAAKLNKLIL